MGESETFRSLSGRALTVGSAVVAVLVIVTIAVSDGWTGILHYGAVPLLFAALVWAVFGRPFLRVTDGGLEIGNVFRYIHVPWPAVTELELRWGLRVVTEFGKFAAWSVPAPKRPHLSGRFTGNAFGGSVGSRWSLPADAGLLDSQAKRSAAGRTESKPAAAASRRWQGLKEAGFLDSPRLDAAKPTTTWNVDVLTACGGLLVLSIIGIATYTG